MAGEYDGVFLDSASPALLQGECGQTDPRLAGTAARTQTFSELGGQTWIAAWDTWIGALDASLATKCVRAYSAETRRREDAETRR